MGERLEYLRKTLADYADQHAKELEDADAELGQAMRDFGDSVPLGCIGQPQQIADVVSFLLGPGADYMTGAIIFVDGGHDAMLRPDGF